MKFETREEKDAELLRLYELYGKPEKFTKLYKLKGLKAMAQLGFTFNARNYDPQSAPSMLPVSDSNGWPVVIVASEAKPTKNQDGGFLELQLEVIDGPVKGAKGATRLNLWNQSAQAVDIAYKQLSALCHVTGVFDVSDSVVLHNIPFRVLVRQQKGNEAYTEVYGFKDINGNDPKNAGAPAAAAAAGPVNQAGGWQGQGPVNNAPVNTAPVNNAPAPGQPGAPSATPWAQPGGNPAPAVIQAPAAGQQWQSGANVAPGQAAPWQR